MNKQSPRPVLFLDGPLKGEVRAVPWPVPMVIKVAKPEPLRYTDLMRPEPAEIAFTEIEYTPEKIKDRDGEIFWVAVSESQTTIRSILERMIRA